MATLGFNDLKNMALPSLWDAAEIAKVQLQDGYTFDRVVAEIEAGMQEFNASLTTMPHYGDLFAVQDPDEPMVEYPIGVSNGFEEATEYGIPEPQRGATTGHMLPLKPYDRSVGWTMMALRKARRSKIDTDMRSVITDARDLWQQKLLNRFFDSDGETVGNTANASVPFADGGATDSTYVPPKSGDGEAFTSAHSHFLRYATIAAAIGPALEHLQEHGHNSPFDVIGARADALTWQALTGWKAPEWPGIVYHASGVERASVRDISEYFGYVETEYGIARLWLTPRVPTNYFGAFKGYGPGDARNPLRVRIDKTVGFGYKLVPGNYANSPLEVALFYAEFGVGVGEDRTNGVCVYIAESGSYTDPTIS